MSAEDVSATAPPASPDPSLVPPPAAPAIEHQEELKAALLAVAQFHNFSARTSPKDEALPSSARAYAVEASTSGGHARITDETAAHPEQVPGARSTALEPSVPPVTGPKSAGPEVAVRRPAAARRWQTAALSFVGLCIVVYFAARGSREPRAVPEQAHPVTPELTAQTPLPGSISPAASGISEQPVQEQANHAPVDIGTAKPLEIGARPQEPGTPPALYLRVGLGPSCPRMLNYRRQFLAAGISDAKVAQLKSTGCALVLGPYAADVVERRRKNHNARRIRGFDSAIVIDDRDFDKWL